MAKETEARQCKRAKCVENWAQKTTLCEVAERRDLSEIWAASVGVSAGASRCCWCWYYLVLAVLAAVLCCSPDTPPESNLDRNLPLLVASFCSPVELSNWPPNRPTRHTYLRRRRSPIPLPVLEHVALIDQFSPIQSAPKMQINRDEEEACLMVPVYLSPPPPQGPQGQTTCCRLAPRSQGLSSARASTAQLEL